jgi:hypothetical protein
VTAAVFKGWKTDRSIRNAQTVTTMSLICAVWHFGKIFFQPHLDRMGYPQHYTSKVKKFMTRILVQTFYVCASRLSIRLNDKGNMLTPTRPVIANQRTKALFLILRHCLHAESGNVALVRHARNVNLNTRKSIESR